MSRTFDLLEITQEELDKLGVRVNGKPPTPDASWPKPLSDAALIGPAGQFVRAVAPETEADPAIRAAAARALAKCGTPKSFGPLERWLEAGDTEVKVECAWSLGILQAKPAEAALRRTLENPDVDVREWSARALENITGDRVLYRDASGKMILPYNLYR